MIMWPSNVRLLGSRVLLRPLVAGDRAALLAAAADGELWNSAVTIIPGADTVDSYLGHALEGRERGVALPFAMTVDSQALVGTSRFWKMDPANRSLEIGHTWIASSWQRSFVNSEAKYLMLRFAFERLGCIRVQFQTDVLNERSRAAILRLGASFEGILRRERVMPNGRKRDTALYAIIDDEWPDVRKRLEAKLEGRTAFQVEAADD
jgi:RimJ/RimL family protein N-acetyltransferase